MLLTALTIVSAVVSLFTGLLAILKHKQRWLAAFSVGLTSALAITIAFNYRALSKKQQEIEHILDPIRQIECFNEAHGRDDLDFMGNGELKGVVMSGMQVLERFKTDFPESYLMVKQMFYDEHHVIKDKEFFEERDALEDAAEAMIQIMSDLYVVNRAQLQD